MQATKNMGQILCPTLAPLHHAGNAKGPGGCHISQLGGVSGECWDGRASFHPPASAISDTGGHAWQGSGQITPPSNKPQVTGSPVEAIASDRDYSSPEAVLNYAKARIHIDPTKEFGELQPAPSLPTPRPGDTGDSSGSVCLCITPKQEHRNPVKCHLLHERNWARRGCLPRNTGFRYTLPNGAREESTSGTDLHFWQR